MKIASILIQNFKSLVDVEISDLSSHPVFIGPSGSGKTSLIEALDLFFSNFANAPTSPTEAFDDKFWYLRDTSLQILLSVEIEFTKEEYKALVSRELGRKLGSTKLNRRITLAAMIEMVKGKPRWTNFARIKDGSLQVLTAKGQPEPTKAPEPVTKVEEQEGNNTRPGSARGD